MPLPDLPYGGVYFRVSAPPERDWERDYAAAAADGATTFRHWFLWSAIERRPGADHWRAYDAQLDLAARHGISTIIAEMLTSAPDWAFHDYPDARMETRDGRRLQSSQSGGTSTAGWPGLCLDHPTTKQLATSFLTRLATRYAGHPGLGGYDVWNECATYTDEHCYCAATTAEFQAWLRRRYGTIEALEDAWSRFGLRDFSEVRAPRTRGAYPEVLDWYAFRVDHHQELLRWRIDTIRAADPDAQITAHGLGRMTSVAAMQAADDWRSARQVDSFGFTWVASRHDGSSWRHYQAADLTRSAAGGKPFWHSEAQGGPLWLQPQVIGRPAADGRVPTGNQVRLWLLQSLAAGARGVFFPRWRPLLSGPLFGAFSPHEVDGERTDRSKAAASVMSWLRAPEHADLRSAVPVRGDVAILFLREAQRFDHAQLGSQGSYESAADAAYQGFFESGFQADWIALEQLDDYETVYMPYPIALSPDTRERLTAWVRLGGTLISEAAPGYVDQQGRVQDQTRGGTLLPLFGVAEATTEFMPDLWEAIHLEGTLRGTGAAMRQAYRVTDAETLATYADGVPAAVQRRVGNGRVVLIGTSLPLGAQRSGTSPATAIAPLLTTLNIMPTVVVSDPVVTARVQVSALRRYVWLTNPTERPRRVVVRTDITEPSLVRGAADADLRATARELAVTVPGEDAVVVSMAAT